MSTHPEGFVMKGKFFKTAAVMACLSSTAAFGFNLDVFGWFQKDNSIDKMIEYIPADTALFVGAVTNKDIVTRSDQMMARLKDSGDGDAFLEVLKSFPESEGLDFIRWFIKDYYEVAPQGGLAMYNHYGLDMEGASVVYLDGIFPVIRVALQDEQAFLNLVKQAALESDLTLGSKTIADETLTTIELTKKDDLVLTLGFMIKDSVLTLSVLSQKDDAVAQEQRFALSKPAQSMPADSWDNDGKTYDFMDYSHGYVSLLNIANAMLDKDVRAHKQLKALMGDELPDLTETQTQCRADIVNIVSGVPRFVFGLNRYDVRGDNMALDFSYALEIKNANILGELSKLRGFIPSYLNTSKDLAIGLGVGLSADAISPVLTNLWNQFTKADFNCAQLQNLQVTLRDNNPAMLSVFTSMAQSLSGVSLSIFDLIKDENSQLGAQYDAIATITTEKPEVLSALASKFLPILNGVQVPTDGSAINLADSGLPINAYVAIKGKHLVAYTGEKSKQVAEQLATEEVKPNGVVAFNMDSTKLGDLIMNMGPLSASMGNDCTDLYTVSTALSAVPFSLKVREDLDGNGYKSAWSMSMNDVSKVTIKRRQDLVNAFKVEYLDEECHWIDIGSETFNQDGTGTFVDTDDSNSCNIFESGFKWSYSMGSIIETNSNNRFRSSCDSEWEQQESVDFSCQILGAKNTEFYCLQDDGDYKALHRYTQK
jgi:hypothetical protein